MGPMGSMGSMGLGRGVDRLIAEIPLMELLSKLHIDLQAKEIRSGKESIKKKVSLFLKKAKNKQKKEPTLTYLFFSQFPESRRI